MTPLVELPFLVSGCLLDPLTLPAMLPPGLDTARHTPLVINGSPVIERFVVVEIGEDTVRGDALPMEETPEESGGKSEIDCNTDDEPLDRRLWVG